MFVLSSPVLGASCNDADAGVACGIDAVAGHESNVAIGNNAQLLPVLVNGAPVQPNRATAVGASAEAVAGATAVGAAAQALGVDGSALGAGSRAIGEGSVALGSSATANTLNSVAIGRQASVTGTGSFGIAIGYAASATDGVAIGGHAKTANGGGVALGDFSEATAFRAVAVGPLAKASAEGATALGYGAEAAAAGTAVGALARAQGSRSVAIGEGSVATDADTVSFGTSNFARRLVNVKAGIADTDGVNVAQLRSIPPALGGGSTFVNGVFVGPTYRLRGGDFTNVGSALTYLDNRITNVELTPGPQGPAGPGGATGPQGPQGPNGTDGAGTGSACSEAVCYDDASKRSVTLNKGGDTVRVGNVSAGVARTDAVNVGQLEAGVTRAINTSNSYTDQRVGELRDDLWRVDRNARGGIAAAMAIAGLPQAYTPGRRMAAMAASGYRGEAGLALGISGITDDGKWVYKVSGSANTTGDFGMTVGAGRQW